MQATATAKAGESASSSHHGEVGSRTSILLIGTSFKTSSIAFRERVIRTLQRDGAARARGNPHLLEGCLLVTCNRIEFYVATDDPNEMEARVFSDLFGSGSARNSFYFKHDKDAVSHLFKVASGLDSLVVGEAQILQQIRDAGAKAEASGEAGPVISSLFVSAFNVGRRVRDSLNIAPHDASVSSFALAFAIKKIGRTPQSVLLIGTGKVAKLAATQLKGSKIYLISRQKNAQDRFPDAKLVAQKELKRVARDVDLVISATRRSGYVLRKGDLPDSRPLVMLDLAFPRNIDPAFKTSRSIQLYDLDDLAAHARAPNEGAALTAGEQLVQDEAEGFIRRLVAKRLSPTLASIYRWAEEVRTTEMDDAVKKLPNLSEDDRRVLEAMSKSLVGKLLAPHANFVKGADCESDQAEKLRLLENVFHPEADG
jgi:glutamyl-tRNA reductase